MKRFAKNIRLILELIAACAAFGISAFVVNDKREKLVKEWEYKEK